jgi:hypothetical protein
MEQLLGFVHVRLIEEMFRLDDSSECRPHSSVRIEFRCHRDAGKLLEIFVEPGDQVWS